MDAREGSAFFREEKNMFDMQKVGERIAVLRKKTGMTQAELAEWLGISYQAVSSWERGATMPDISKLVELSRALHTTVDALLSGEAAAAPIQQKTESVADAEETMEVDKTAGSEAAQEMETVEEEEKAQEKRGDFSGSLQDLMADINGRLSDGMDVLRDKLQQMRIEVSGKVKYGEEDGKPVISIPQENKHDRVIIRIEDGGKKEATRGRVSSDTIGALACYMDQETLEDELVQAINDGDDDTVEEIACYLEPDTIERAMDRAQEPLTSEMLEALSTYMGSDVLEECAVQALNEGDEDALEEIICHMDDEVIERALERYAGELTVEMVEILACHASERALDLIIQKCDVEDSDALEELAPYMNQRQMRELLKRMRNS